MKSSTCPRSFEVEALRNGRLGGAERASFERHLSTCGACSHEARALAALGDALRAGSNARVDELHVRRGRTRLLSAFDRALISERNPWPKRAAVALVACAVVAVGLLVFFRLQPTTLPVAVLDSTVKATVDSVWSRRFGAGRESILLERGELEVHVQRKDGQPKLVVELPDGVLEDEGTVFTVTVRDARTTRVLVREGSVTLSIRGQTPKRVAAGESWTAAPEVKAPSREPLPIEPEQQHESARPNEPAEPRREPTLPAPARSSSARAAMSAASAANSATQGAADDFRAAVAAFNRGAHAEAASRLGSFLERHPRDARAEDAAYLRVLALRKTGNESSMRRAAGDYLRRYPAGFRHSEVEELLR